MTVTLAFKAFAKAIPCLTPFLERSDPSVLMRISAYIRGLPCSSNIFPKKVILSLYGPIVAVRLRANLEAHSWTNERPGIGPVQTPRSTARRCRGALAPSHHAARLGKSRDRNLTREPLEVRRRLLQTKLLPKLKEPLC